MRLERGDIWRPPRIVGCPIYDKNERIFAEDYIDTIFGRVNIVGIYYHISSILKLLFKIASKRKLDSTRKCFIF